MSKFWRHFISNGRKGHAGSYLGLQGCRTRLERAVVEQLPRSQASGVEVQIIVPGGPADEAGILEQDVILELAERPTRGVDELHQLLARLPAGRPVTLRLLRRQRLLERLVVLGD